MEAINRIAYLPVNQAWVYLFGDQIISIDGKRFFESRKELQETLARKGITVLTDNTVR